MCYYYTFTFLKYIFIWRSVYRRKKHENWIFLFKFCDILFNWKTISKWKKSTFCEKSFCKSQWLVFLFEENGCLKLWEIFIEEIVLAFQILWNVTWWPSTIWPDFIKHKWWTSSYWNFARQSGKVVRRTIDKISDWLIDFNGISFGIQSYFFFVLLFLKSYFFWTRSYRIWICTTTPGQSRPGNNGNKVTHSLQISGIWASPSDAV